jgi:hypothetical protein
VEVKHVGFNNRDFKPKETERLKKEYFASVAMGNCNNYVRHVKKIRRDVESKRGTEGYQAYHHDFVGR